MKNLLEFQNQFFQHAVNKVINSLESDNYNIDLSKYDHTEVKLGLEKEQEHTDDPKELSKIVADHLDEDPAYYSKMEKAGFDDSLNLFQKNIKAEIDEGRSKRRFLNTLQRDIKSDIIGIVKNELQRFIENKILVIRKFYFRDKYKKHPIMKNFGDVYVIAKDDSNFTGGGGEYYYNNGTIETPDKTYTTSRGDFVFYVHIPSDTKKFDDLKEVFQKFVDNLTETIGHELIHFFDDFKGPTGLQPVPKQDIFYGMSKHLKKEYDYYMDDDEVSSYVEAAMKRARRLRIPFIKALYDSIYRERIEPIFRRSPYLIQIKNLILYKYLRFSMRKYNRVVDSPKANKYYADLEAYIQRNNLQDYIPDKEAEEKEKRMKAKDLRRQAWEKEHGEDDEFLEESKTQLSKYWNKRAKSRAKRAGRHFPNNKDKEWASEQEQKSKDVGSTLKKAFEDEIKESEEITKKMNEIINSVKKKKIFKGKDPFVSGITGRAKGFKQKHKGSMKAAPFETIGPLGEGEDYEN